MFHCFPYWLFIKQKILKIFQHEQHNTTHIINVSNDKSTNLYIINNMNLQEFIYILSNLKHVNAKLTSILQCIQFHIHNDILLQDQEFIVLSNQLLDLLIRQNYIIQKQSNSNIECIMLNTSNDLYIIKQLHLQQIFILHKMQEYLQEHSYMQSQQIYNLLLLELFMLIKLYHEQIEDIQIF